MIKTLSLVLERCGINFEEKNEIYNNLLIEKLWDNLNVCFINSWKIQSIKISIDELNKEKNKGSKQKNSETGNNNRRTVQRRIQNYLPQTNNWGEIHVPFTHHGEDENGLQFLDNNLTRGNRGMISLDNETDNGTISTLIFEYLQQLLPLYETYLIIKSPKIRLLVDTQLNEEEIKQYFEENELTDKINLKLFIEYWNTINNHQSLLNLLIHENNQLLKTSFKLLLNTPKLLSFENKLSYFRTELHSRFEDRQRYQNIRLTVRRDHVLDDSYHQLKHRTNEELLGSLKVTFSGEPGIDAGGVTRDWYHTLSKAMFNPSYALFTRSEKKNIYQPNRFSYINLDHLEYFKFIGKIMGKAIHDHINLEAYFTRSFYKHILGMPVTYHDMEELDHMYYKSILYILENNSAEQLQLYFSADFDDLGEKKVVDLVPNGSKILVNDQNKQEYIQLICELKMTKSIKQQIDFFLKGFYELIPKDLISIFNEKDLELLISGLPEIDIEDLKNNTRYKGYEETDEHVKWFWEIVTEFTHEERAKLLQFVTGTSNVPLEGFGGLRGMNGLQKLQIHRSPNIDRLPTSHTCFLQLDLPCYKSKQIMKDRLSFAINETKGFGFV